MLSEKTGKTVKKVTILKNGVEILFNDDSKIKISESTFVRYYLYEGKILSDSDIKKVLETETLSKARDYAFKVASKKYYSEGQIRDKLNKFDLDEEKVNRIINELKESLLIDDKEYVSFYLRLFENKNYGKERITSELRKDYIDESLIKGIKFTDYNELKKANKELSHFIKINQNKNYTSLFKSSFNHLALYGFESKIINEVMSDLKNQYDFKKEFAKLKMDFEKAKKKYSSLDESLSKNKIFSYLLRRGYKVEDIKKVVGGDEDEIYQGI